MGELVGVGAWLEAIQVRVKEHRVEVKPLLQVQAHLQERRMPEELSVPRSVKRVKSLFKVK